MSEINVRRATASDLAAAAELAGLLARMHHDTDPERFFLPERVVEGYTWWFERVIRDPEAVLLVAELDGKVVGYAYGALSERDWNLLLDAHATLHDLYVADDRRRHGTGEALLRAILAELEKLGAERIVLSTMPSNLPAQRLFARFGFRVTFLEMTRNHPASTPSAASRK